LAIGDGNEAYRSKLVTREEELIQLSNKGCGCQTEGTNKWLMKKSIIKSSLNIHCNSAYPCRNKENSLSVYALLGGLRSVREIQWSVSAIFEKWSDSELHACIRAEEHI